MTDRFEIILNNDIADFDFNFSVNIPESDQKLRTNKVGLFVC